MTNYEYWKNTIQAIWDKGNHVGLTEEEVPCSCRSIRCENCIICGGNNCQEIAFKWLMAEHVDKPKLTRKERQFCELVETGYIARDFNGSVYYYNNRPDKKGALWYSIPKDSTNLKRILFSNNHFKFIEWSDKEPWAIEDLLKLRVEE